MSKSIKKITEMIESFRRAKEAEQENKGNKWEYYMGCEHGLRNALDIINVRGGK